MRPIAFSMYGPTSFYISPVPDQVYSMELDTIIQPTDLVTQDQVDEIEKIRYEVCDKAETPLQNIIDEIVGLYLSTIYKLKFLA